MPTFSPTIAVVAIRIDLSLAEERWCAVHADAPHGIGPGGAPIRFCRVVPAGAGQHGRRFLAVHFSRRRPEWPQTRRGNCSGLSQDRPSTADQFFVPTAPRSAAWGTKNGTAGPSLQFFVPT